MKCFIPDVKQSPNAIEIPFSFNKSTMIIRNSPSNILCFMPNVAIV